jgi:hypothetical protein
MKIDVTIKLNPSYEPDALDEVSVTADDPYLNTVFRLPKSETRDLASGPGTLELTSEEPPEDGRRDKADDSDRDDDRDDNPRKSSKD